MSDDGLVPIESDSANGPREGLGRHDAVPEGQEGYETASPEGTAAVWKPKEKGVKAAAPPPLSQRSDSNLTFHDIRERLYGVTVEDEVDEPLPPPAPRYRERPATPPLEERERSYQQTIGPVTERRGPGRPRKSVT